MTQKQFIKEILKFILLLFIGCLIIGYISTKPMLISIILGVLWGAYLGKRFYDKM